MSRASVVRAEVSISISMITLHGEMVDAGIYRNNMLWRSLVQRLLLTQAVSKLPLSSGVRVANRGPEDYELPRNAASPVKS
ncbi:hypothetical protein D3C76_1225660 [compost metagenome]